MLFPAAAAAQPLPIRAAKEMLEELRKPENADVSLWVSNFEIYGGKARANALCPAL